MENNEKKLIEGLLAGDEACYTQLVLNYHGMLTRLAKAIVWESIAEEVVQEAWIAIIKALPNFEGRSSLKTWISRIVINTAKSRLRHESHRSPPKGKNNSESAGLDPTRFKRGGGWEDPPIPWHAETPEALLESEDLSCCLEKTLQQLPPMQQTVMIMHDVEGIPMKTLCNILEIDASNGRVLLHRARTQLRMMVEDYMRTGQC